ncbi:hypothetical protein PV433_11890 [Paenibacillus sp. GYB004]|uniref:hypothetical protein n=1 Tax=Paenibacillus sp. GYB004 TaxID=2994393 RepID=UPI002F96DCD1
MPPIKRIQPVQKTLEQPPKIVNQSLSLVRPVQDYLKDDRYLSEIADAQVVEINGKPMLRLGTKIADEDGYEQAETFLLKPDFRHQSTSFYKLLEITGCMPDRGKALAVDSLIGQQVMLSLKTVTKNGNIYTNIDDVEPVPDEEGDVDVDVDVDVNVDVNVDDSED